MPTKPRVRSDEEMSEMMNNALNAIKYVMPDLPVICVVAFPCKNEDGTFVFSGANVAPDQQKMILTVALEGLKERGAKHYDS